MNKISAALLSLALMAMICLTGCNETAAPSSVDSPTSSAVTTTETTPTTAPTKPVTLDDLPGRVVGTFQGKTILLQYAAISDLTIDLEFSKPFHNGYAIVRPIPATIDSDAYQETVAFVDEQAHVLGDTFYLQAMPFNAEGLARVQKLDGSWIYIDMTGKEVCAAQEPDIPMSEGQFYQEENLYGLQDANGQPITKPLYESVGYVFQEGLCFARLAAGEHRNVLIDTTGQVRTTLPDDCVFAQAFDNDTIVVWYSTGLPYAQYRLFNTKGQLLNNTYFDKIGNFVDGLGPVVQDGQMGLIDNQGNVIIEPSLPVENYYRAELCLSESYILAQINGNQLAILQVVR